jgi:hypothetical protein
MKQSISRIIALALAVLAFVTLAMRFSARHL